MLPVSCPFRMSHSSSTSLTLFLAVSIVTARFTKSWTPSTATPARRRPVERRQPTLVCFASLGAAIPSTNRSANNDDRIPTITPTNFISIPECLDLLASDHPSQNSVRFIDGSWYHKGSRNGRVDFLQGPRIPRAVYFDLDEIATTQELFPDLNPRGLSHMLPPPALMEAFMNITSIQPFDDIIIYGSGPDCAFLPRIWFTIRYVWGHERTKILRGSLEDWMAAGGPVENRDKRWNKATSVASSSEEQPIQSTAPLARTLLDWTKRSSSSGSTSLLHPVTPRPRMTSRSAIRIIDGDTMMAYVAASLSTTTTSNQDITTVDERLVIVDTRGSSFARGHMPGAVHVPYSSLYAGGGGMMAGMEQVVRDALALPFMDDNTAVTAGSDDVSQQSLSPLPLRVVVTCGSGVSVCSFILALDECGLLLPCLSRNSDCSRSCDSNDNDTTNDSFPRIRISALDVYDGSWEEWDKLGTAPKVVDIDR